MRVHLIWLLLAVGCIQIPALAASDRSNLDLRIVVDVSESMEAADSENLRGDAVEYLIRNAPDQGHAGIWSYANYVRKVAQHGESGALWKQIASIHAGSLAADGEAANLVGALEAATWDRSDIGDVKDLVLIGNGAMRPESAEARQALLRDWASQLAEQRIRVHVIALGDIAAGDADLLRQLTELSRGIYREVTDSASLRKALVDLDKVLLAAPQVQLDSQGRFQVAPGAKRMTLAWLEPQGLQDTPKLTQPDGKTLTRLTGLPRGRWLVAQAFEMVTIEEPQPGWWHLDAPNPDRIGVYGEIDIRVQGLDATVVPTDESRVTINLYSQSKRISHPDFLQLLNVSAWVLVEDEMRPLPVDAVQDGFVAHFVNLEDGAHELVVEVVAPTFSRRIQIPFTVANPLVVDIVTTAEGSAMAWLQFSHPQVDYASLRATGIVRKPPQIASLIPAQRMPAGMWGIPLGHDEGIIEVAFTAAGNYLNGDGVFLKTKPHALNLPLPEGASRQLRFDANGKLLQDSEPLTTESNVVVSTNQSDASGQRIAVTPQAEALLPAPPEEPSLPLIPLWFVAVISLLNLAIAGVVWWLNKPKPLLLEPV